MAIEKWISGSGVGLTWTAAFGASDLNSMPSGSSILSSGGAINNGTPLDLFADISISLGSFTPLAPNNISVFIYPLNQDGTTYGDGQLTAGTQAAKTPAAPYWVGNIILTLVAGVQVGTLGGIRLPPGPFLFVIQNNAGATLASSGNVVKYWTYNLQVA